MDSLEEQVMKNMQTEIDELKLHNKVLMNALNALVDTLKLEAGLRISNSDEPGL
jgi:hypothetical protein